MTNIAQNIDVMTHYAAILMGLGFSGLGLTMRRGQKQNWKALFFGGLAMLVIGMLPF
jgi:hypothetical protein